MPRVHGMPQGCAWGLFDKDGKKDHLGCLNLLTPKVVQEAFKEARDGVSISLNWPLGAIQSPGFGRKGLVHKIRSFQGEPFSMCAWEDEIEFNTQCSSQWDSLVHFAHQPSGLNYNSTSPDASQLTQPFDHLDDDKAFPTFNHWHERGGLVGRGILLGYRDYAAAHNIKYDVLDSHQISAQDLEAVAAYQGTNFKHGDILLIRCGVTDELTGTSAEEQEKRLGTHRAVGIKGHIETARWV